MERERLTHFATRLLREAGLTTAGAGDSVRLLGRGVQADVLLAPATAGRPGVVVKVFRDDQPDPRAAMNDEFDALREMHARVDGRRVGPWTLRSPEPLFKSTERPAIGMSLVPGRRLGQVIDESVPLPDGLPDVIAQALKLYWVAGRIYGDLNLDNILVDIQSRTVSFVDVGMPEPIYACSAVPQTWNPASRDLAYLLFETAASVRKGLLRPGSRSRRMAFASKLLGRVYADIPLPADRHSLTDEILGCAAVHLGRIRVGASPAGVWRRWVRRFAGREISAALGHAVAPTASVEEPNPLTQLHAVPAFAPPRAVIRLGDTTPRPHALRTPSNR